MQRRVWFISGSSKGFGRLLCEAVLKRGHYVVAAARDIGSLRDLARTYGDALLLQKADMTHSSQISDALHRGRAHFGRLCVIVTAAGYTQFGAIEEVSREEAWTSIETHVLGMLSVVQAALPILRAQGFGHILPISAAGGDGAFPMRFPAAKFAIEGIVEALAGEVADFGINITAIDLSMGMASSLAEHSSRYSKRLPDYDKVRAQLQPLMKPAVSADPSTMVDAIFKLIDLPMPPLRLAPGSTVRKGSIRHGEQRPIGATGSRI